MNDIIQFTTFIALIVSAIGSSLMTQVENIKKGDFMKTAKFLIYLIVGMTIAGVLRFTPEFAKYLPVEFQNYSINFVLVLGFGFGLTATGAFDTIKKFKNIKENE